MELGAKVMTVSDSNGVNLFENGMSQDDFILILECKNTQRGRLSSLKDKLSSGIFMEGQTPWTLDVPFDVALPCAN